MCFNCFTEMVKCAKCEKELGFFEQSYDYKDGGGYSIKYCSECDHKFRSYGNTDSSLTSNDIAWGIVKGYFTIVIIIALIISLIIIWSS